MAIKINDYTYGELKEAYQIAANVVALYGDAYLPVFKRLHTEMEKMDYQAGIKNIALRIAASPVKSNNKVSERKANIRNSSKALDL